MVTSVNTNINAMAAIQSLTDIGNQMTMTQAHIQSGLKVGSASDNPAVFTIAQGLRANVNALQAVTDSLATGTATVQAQTQGATSISNALSTLLKTVTQAQNQTDPATLAANNATITNALANIDAYANASTINGVNLLSTGSTLNVLSNVSGASTTVTTAAASTSAGLGLTGLSVTTGGKTLSTNATPVANAATVTYIAGGKTTIFEFTDNSAPLTSTPAANTTIVGVQVGATDSASMGNLLSAMQANGAAASESTSGVITVSGGTTTASALTTATVSGGASAIAAVNAAIVTIGATLSKLGSATLQLQGLSDFTAKLSTSVTTSLGAIVDANLSEESAKLSSLQTKQSLAIQSLSLANQGPSALMQLFR